MLPSQALVSAVPDPVGPGSFGSISSSLQQIAGGFGSVVAGLILVQRSDGLFENFDTVGYILVETSALTVFMIYYIDRMVMASVQP